MERALSKLKKLAINSPSAHLHVSANLVLETLCDRHLY